MHTDKWSIVHNPNGTSVDVRRTGAITWTWRAFNAASERVAHGEASLRTTGLRAAQRSLKQTGHA